MKFCKLVQGTLVFTALCVADQSFAQMQQQQRPQMQAGPQTQSIQQQQGLPVRGGNGGNPFFLDCGADGALVYVGIVHTPNMVTAFETTCVKFKSDATWATPYYLSSRTGGKGTTYLPYYCYAGHVMTAMFGRSGTLLDQVGFHCAKLVAQGGVLRVVSAGSGGFPEGGTGGTPFQDNCPDGQVARGLRGRSGAAIDQVQLVCHYPAPFTPPTAGLQSTNSSSVAAKLGVQKQALGQTKDVITLNYPHLIMPGGDRREPGQLMIMSTSTVDMGFSIQNRGWNGNYMTSVANVPWIVRMNGQVIAQGAVSSLTNFVQFLSALPWGAWKATAGRHTFSVELDPNNTLGEDAESRKNNIASWTVEVMKEWAFRIVSFNVTPNPPSSSSPSSTPNQFKLVVQNDRAASRSMTLRFGVLDPSAETSGLRTRQVAARPLQAWSSSNCSGDAEVDLKHGENVIELPFARCANRGDVRKIAVVLDPRNERGEAPADLLDNEAELTVTWQ